METSIPQFGPREYIGFLIAVAVIIVFLISAIKLSFTKNKDNVEGEVSAENKTFSFATKNLTVVTLIVSGVLLAVISTAALADPQKGWVYLGPGHGNYVWNFEKENKSRDFKVNDIVKAINDVNIREKHFSTFTETWLSVLSPPTPKITGIVKRGECVKINGFTSVGLNKVWMNITKTNCN